MILPLIKAQCKANGVPEKYAEKIQKVFNIEKEEGIDVFVKMFKDNLLPDLEANKPEDAEKIKKAAIAEYEKAHKIKDGKPVEKKEPDKEPDYSTLSPEVKAILESNNKQIAELTKLVTGMSESQVKAQKLQDVKAKLKGKIDDDMLDDYAGRVNLGAENLDAEIEAQVQSFTTLKQKFIDKAVKEGTYVPAASSAANDADFDSFIKSKTEDKGSEFAAKTL